MRAGKSQSIPECVGNSSSDGRHARFALGLILSSAEPWDMALRVEILYVEFEYDEMIQD